MSPKDIIDRLEEINAEERILSDKGNTLWEEKNNLRNKYKSLTGNDI